MGLLVAARFQKIYCVPVAYPLAVNVLSDLAFEHFEHFRARSEGCLIRGQIKAIG
jgi:hypothetical protein